MSAKFTLAKKERLKHRKLIEGLFSKGKDTYKYPVKIVYQSIKPALDNPLKFSVTIPKKSFKRAVDRNLLKRRIKEAYRINHLELQKQFEQADESLILMVIYVSKKIEDYQVIENAIKQLVSNLTFKFRKDR